MRVAKWPFFAFEEKIRKALATSEQHHNRFLEEGQTAGR
jgi:hypothetical protein